MTEKNLRLGLNLGQSRHYTKEEETGTYLTFYYYLVGISTWTKRIGSQIPCCYFSGSPLSFLPDFYSRISELNLVRGQVNTHRIA